MSKTVVVAVVLGMLLVSAGAAFAQMYGGYGAPAEQTKPYLRGKVGWFEPTESDLDGAVAFGVDYVIPQQMAFLSIDRLHADNTFADSTTWSLLVGMYRPIESGSHSFYYGAGIGIARETVETPLGDVDDTRFAWEVGGGMLISTKGFAELMYRDGGSDGNRGVVLYLGIGY
jgi:hypothetical protein